MKEAIEVELPGAHVAFSTRLGGFSDGPYASLNLGILTDDDGDRVLANREHLADALGIEEAAMGMQVHGTDLATWDAPSTELIEVDGHVTDRPGPGAAGADRRLPARGAGRARAGWRCCTAAGAGSRAASSPTASRPSTSRPSRSSGPASARPTSRSGEEVLEAFADVPEAADGRMLDLRAVAEARLRAAGVQDVRHVDLCTYERDDLFFSHRRDGGVTGRQAGLVWLT